MDCASSVALTPVYRVPTHSRAARAIACNGRNPATRRGIEELAADGPVKGFVLKLSAIWRGLR